MPTISLSEYWFTWLERVVKTGIRHSKAQIVAEALAKAHVQPIFYEGAKTKLMLHTTASCITARLRHAFLVRHRRLIENEVEEYLEVKAEIKERKEALK